MNVRMHSYKHTHIPPQSLAFSTSPDGNIGGRGFQNVPMTPADNFIKQKLTNGRWYVIISPC